MWSQRIGMIKKYKANNISQKNCTFALEGGQREANAFGIIKTEKTKK
jgi:hypothetical protein